MLRVSLCLDVSAAIDSEVQILKTVCREGASYQIPDKTVTHNYKTRAMTGWSQRTWTWRKSDGEIAISHALIARTLKKLASCYITVHGRRLRLLNRSASVLWYWRSCSKATIQSTIPGKGSLWIRDDSSLFFSASKNRQWVLLLENSRTSAARRSFAAGRTSTIVGLWPIEYLANRLRPRSRM